VTRHRATLVATPPRGHAWSQHKTFGTGPGRPPHAAYGRRKALVAVGRQGGVCQDDRLEAILAAGR